MNMDRPPMNTFYMALKGGRDMFKQAVIYYPTDEKALAQIYKEIASFRCAAAIRYIESLNLNDKQIDLLFVGLAEEVAAMAQECINKTA
jgi:hypothetical protein